MSQTTDLTWQTPLASYFANLEAGNFEAAAQCFGLNALYVRPQMPDGTGSMAMHAVSGRSAILAYFHRRGKQGGHHAVTRWLAIDSLCFVEGIVELPELPEPVLFMSSAQFDADGLITRYVSVPAVLDAAAFVAVTQVASS